MTNRNTGFSLVELLVVLAVISVLASVLLPAVQAARAKAQGGQCLSNMKNLVMAISNYESLHKVFPAGQISSMKRLKSAVPGFVTDPEEPTKSYSDSQTGQDQGTSWMVQILPMIDQANLFNAWKFDRNVRSNGDADGGTGPARADIAIYYCPSRRSGMNVGTYTNVLRVDSGEPAQNGAPAWTSGGNDYAGAAGSGIVFDDTTRGTYRMNQAQLEGTEDSRGVSYFNQHRSNRGVFGVNSSTRVGDISDGTSQTLMVCERRLTNLADPGSQRSSDGWAWGGPATLLSTRITPHTGVITNNVQSSVNLTGHYDSADSSHVGLVTVGFADGSVKQISTGIDLRTWQNLGNMASGTAVRVPD